MTIATATKAQQRYAADLARDRGYPSVIAARQDMLGRQEIGSLGKIEISELIDWLAKPATPAKSAWDLMLEASAAYRDGDHTTAAALLTQAEKAPGAERLTAKIAQARVALGQ